MRSQTLKLFTIIIVTAIITAFLTHYLCKKKDQVVIPDKDRSTTICMDYDVEPPAMLTTELVKSMVVKYDSVQLNNIQSATTNAVPRDARAIWFDLETLKKFMYHIEHNVSKNYTLSRNKKIGVRIYYAAYPKNQKMKEMASSQADPNFSYNPNYENLHTLVMIPTITGEDGINYDFNPLDATTYSGFVNMDKKNIYSFINSNYSILSLGTSSNPTATVNGTSQSGTNNISARNHGMLSPPDAINGFGF
ncbi:MAG: hypothetical protein K2P85_00310 [Flavobacteriaceae bacterium]|nr:hypothetical protein [Flavobacteriaceae bacterium]